MRRAPTSAKKPPAAPPSFAANRDRLAAMRGVTEKFKGWKPAPEVVRNIRAVPTCLLDYDCAVGVGGHPLERISLVYGPSDHGKSRLTTALGRSFLARDHFFALVDAEHTATPGWLRTLMGELVEHPGFVALPSSTYEKAVDGVREFGTTIAEQRAAGKLPPDTSGIVVVDSIRKLVPKDFVKRLAADIGGDEPKRRFGGAKGVDGYGGRGAQIKAALNAAWMDSLVPLLAETGISVVIVSRETDGEDGEIKVGGGKALKYESSLWLRVLKDWMTEGEGKERKTIGEVHTVAIERSKVANKGEETIYAAFRVSNGTVAPEGFWPEADALEVGLERAVIDLRGSWYAFDGKRIGNGRMAALARLKSEPELLERIVRAVREKVSK